MNDFKTIIANLKFWLILFAVISPIAACSYWLAQDDKRMYKIFISECERKKVDGSKPAETDCAVEWRKAYRETFGRNP